MIYGGEKGFVKGCLAEAQEQYVSDVSNVPKYSAGVLSLYMHGNVARGPKETLW